MNILQIGNKIPLVDGKAILPAVAPIADEPITITENGTINTPSDLRYNPIIVDVQGGGQDTSPYIVTTAKITIASDSTSFVYDFGNANINSDNTPIIYCFNPNWDTEFTSTTWRAYGFGVVANTNSGTLTSRTKGIWTDEGSGGTHQGWITNGVTASFDNGVFTLSNSKGCKFLAGTTFNFFAITLKDWT